MPGFTTPDGFIYPVQGDQPFTGLTPDVAGVEVFQEQVQSKFTTLEAGTIADILTRLGDVEAAVAAIRWRRISSGTITPGDFSIPVPAGYSRLQLTMTGDMDGTGNVRLQVNGDNTSGRHRYGYVAIDAEGTPEVPDYADDISWRLTEWATVESNTLVVDIFPTDGSANPGFHCIGHRDSIGASAHRILLQWGKYQQDAIVSSLRVIDEGANFIGSQNNWWLDGYLA